jgi:uncharacterized heparinase superfamily protein
MFRQDNYHSNIYPRLSIKKSRYRRLSLSELKKLVDCGLNSTNELKDRLELMPNNFRSVEEWDLVPSIEKVYPVIKFFSKEDIRHTAFEKVTFVGTVNYHLKPVL